jgi:mevalonate kinase
MTLGTQDDASDAVAVAFRALLEAMRSQLPPLPPHAVDVEVRLPAGGGLGCSAALGVAIARALAPAATQDEIERCVMAWERVFHGNPSGVDAAVSSRGGCIQFRRGREPETVDVPGTLHLCVGSTGVASSTKSMVDKVACARRRQPERVDSSFAAIGSLVHDARRAIDDGDWPALGRLMTQNQMLLSDLDVSTRDIDRMCALASRAGALGAKLTGSGGGGSVIAIVPSAAAAESVLATWQSEGFDGFATRVAGDMRGSGPDRELSEPPRERPDSRTAP